MTNTSKWLTNVLIVFGLAVVFCLDKAQGFTGSVVARAGIWELHSGKDSFTDKPSCVIAAPKQPFIQVSIGVFYIIYETRGGLQGYEIRLDDNPPSGHQLPSKIEKQMNTIAIKGSAFNRILKSKRLRVQTLTLIAGLINEDVNLYGLATLYKKMKSLCPKN